MKIKPKSDDYYKKYRYLIWRDDIGFLHLDTFSFEDLKRFSENIEQQIQNRFSAEAEPLLDLDVDSKI
jgi:hypothetical protein